VSAERETGADAAEALNGAKVDGLTASGATAGADV